MHRDLICINTTHLNSALFFLYLLVVLCCFHIYVWCCLAFRKFLKNTCGAFRLAGLAGLGLFSLCCLHCFGEINKWLAFRLFSKNDFCDLASVLSPVLSAVLSRPVLSHVLSCPVRAHNDAQQVIYHCQMDRADGMREAIQLKTIENHLK